MHLILSTGNAGKVRELRDLLGKHYTVLSKKEVGLGDFEVAETGATLEENARLKAQALYEKLCEKTGKTTFHVLADDTGLFVDALAGEPGVYSARYAGAKATDAKNREKLLHALADVPEERRTAHFLTVLVLRTEDGFYETQGRLDGRIVRKPRGKNGFGYDSVFEVAGRTLAEYSEAEKNAVSHRGRALRALADWLAEREEREQ
uniref:RdgB/HAM1 family non-canonical purine NTP pyrophosphatase n=1 Tax=Ndongobacter massiliensis TaxID=1871025 RepID=UPI000930F528|nr:RdgB/HAM1 family non-canonical purine NTP pyrophosphatase [Ndongobacter massiliensis]